MKHCEKTVHYSEKQCKQEFTINICLNFVTALNQCICEGCAIDSPCQWSYDCMTKTFSVLVIELSSLLMNVKLQIQCEKIIAYVMSHLISCIH